MFVSTTAVIVLMAPLVPRQRALYSGFVQACTVLGHRYRFSAEGPTMTWVCERCGADGGAKTYASAAEAQHFADAFDREDRHDIGRRAPLVGLLPLRLWRAWRAHRT